MQNYDDFFQGILLSLIDSFEFDVILSGKNYWESINELIGW